MPAFSSSTKYQLIENKCEILNKQNGFVEIIWNN